MLSNFKPEKEERPINCIKIAGTQILQILSIDLNQGWEITNIEFDDCCPSNYIDKLVVTFEKIREKYKMHDEQNIGTTQTSETESATINPNNTIKQLPSIQSEIIRCKDCKHHWTHKCMDSMPIESCDLGQTFYDAEVDYCSLAERREE